MRAWLEQYEVMIGTMVIVAVALVLAVTPVFV